MVVVQHRSKRKQSGGRYTSSRKKRKFEIGRAPTLTKIGKNDTKVIRAKGGRSKLRMMVAEKANVFDPASKKYSVVKINTVAENPANRHFIRRNIITKGGVINTEKGKAKVTSRPGQDGIVNAVLISK